MNYEGSGRGSIKVLFGLSPQGTEESHEDIVQEKSLLIVAYFQ
jgi:hypothetical protein